MPRCGRARLQFPRPRILAFFSRRFPPAPMRSPHYEIAHPPNIADTPPHTTSIPGILSWPLARFTLVGKRPGHGVWLLSRKEVGAAGRKEMVVARTRHWGGKGGRTGDGPTIAHAPDIPRSRNFLCFCPSVSISTFLCLEANLQLCPFGSVLCRFNLTFARPSMAAPSSFHQIFF